MQASVLDGFAFDPFSFQQDGLTASEVDVGRRQIVDALVVAQVIVVGDEGFDPSLELAGDVAPNFYPVAIGVWSSVMPCWAGGGGDPRSGAVGGAQRSGSPC